MRLSSSDEIHSTLSRVEEAVVVETNREIEKRWNSSNKESRIPSGEVAAVDFQGRRGDSRLPGQSGH